MKKTFLLLFLAGVTLAIGLVYSCSRNPKSESKNGVSKPVHNKQFVGDATCASCHAAEAEAWEGSDHFYAMREANSHSVRADFNNTTFKLDGDRYRFFRQDSLFMVEAPGPEGEKQQYQITYTFGWEPLQQYLIDFGKGKLQVLNIAWDTNEEHWFAMNPDQELQHGDWLHWTGAAMNWNTMCADCHSTNLQQNYIAKTDSFNTTWSSINVSCEACHGPGKDHVEFAQSKEIEEASTEEIKQDLRLTSNTPQLEQVKQCAQCHSLREEVAPGYPHNGNYMDYYSPTLPHPQSYFADGQIKDEVYVYGSFLQSKMFAEEGVKCNDCHDPHSLELKANVTDNSLCMQCHESQYNTKDHFKHKIDTEASQCVNCHMPGRYYMQVDYRRDHSFRVPRPDLSTRFDTPNACNDCHTDKSAQWAANAIEQWYGPNRADHFSEILLKADAGEQNIDDLRALASDTLQPNIARATAIWYLRQFPGSESISLLKKTIHDESPLVRKSTAQLLTNYPERQRITLLQDALNDSVRSVRIAAAGGLASFSASDMELKKVYKEAMTEYKNYLDLVQYFPQGQMNRGQFYENQGKPQKAIQAYKKALKKDHKFNAARINLAHLYNSLGKNNKATGLLQKVVEQEPDYGPAYYSLALLLAEQKQLKQAAPNFAKAAKRMPENSRIFYNWAISLQQLGKTNKAEDTYKQAIELEPDNADYRYGLITLFMQQQQYDSALNQVDILIEQHPNDRQFRTLQQQIKQRAKK